MGETSLKWVRPLHSIVCILYDDDGSKIVDINIEGISLEIRHMAIVSWEVVSFRSLLLKTMLQN